MTKRNKIVNHNPQRLIKVGIIIFSLSFSSALLVGWMVKYPKMHLINLKTIGLNKNDQLIARGNIDTDIVNEVKEQLVSNSQTMQINQNGNIYKAHIVDLSINNCDSLICSSTFIFQVYDYNGKNIPDTVNLRFSTKGNNLYKELFDSIF